MAGRGSGGLKPFDLDGVGGRMKVTSGPNRGLTTSRPSYRRGGPLVNLL